MLLDPTRFSFTDTLERNYPVFKRELAQLADEEFDPWPETNAYEGEWKIFPFYGKEQSPDGYHVDLGATCARCPDSAAALMDLPRLRLASFSRMGPGCAIYPHVDRHNPNVLRVHLGLTIPEGAMMMIEGEYHTWTEGKLLLFDGQREHGTVNHAPVPRDVLLVDLELTPEEAEFVWG